MRVTNVLIYFILWVFFLKYIMTLISASRNKLLPVASTDSWFSLHTSQNLPADSCNLSKELSSLLTSQDFTQESTVVLECELSLKKTQQKRVF